MANPPQASMDLQPPEESPGPSFWRVDKILLIIYAGLMVWHVWRSGAVEPVRSLGLLFLALCLGLCWLADTRLQPRIAEKVVIRRRWVANWCIAGFWVAWVLVLAIYSTAEEFELVELAFGLDRESDGMGSPEGARPGFGSPVYLGLLYLLYVIFLIVCGAFKLPPDPEPTPPPPKPPRPPGMQDPVITHRWWEKYY